MKIAFVGVKRRYSGLQEGYPYFFNRYHLELPFYYARDGENDVVLTTLDYEGELVFNENSRLQCVTEDKFKDQFFKWNPDITIHWRRWFGSLHKPGSISVILCQDHSFDNTWQEEASKAYKDGDLYGILCFPTWHKRNLLRECPWLDSERAIDGLTLGVDTDVYRPSNNKDPYRMLWASDPGRGLEYAIQLAHILHKKDNRFVLEVCYPDYVNNDRCMLGSLPFINVHHNMPNGKKLWDLFGECGILPYTSIFAEPSSRSHRQAQAAGSLVLYPPNMGSPSELIRDNLTGIVAPFNEWPRKIIDLIDSGEWKSIGARARNMAFKENWKVQANRFNEYFNKLLGEL